MAAPHPALLPLIRGRDVPEGIRITPPLVASAEEHGVAPLLSAAQERDQIPGKSSSLTRLAMRRLEATAASTDADRALDSLALVCRDKAIEICLFKGVPVARHWYSERDLRPVSDIDAFTNPADPDAIARLVREFNPHAARAATVQTKAGRSFDHSILVSEFSVDVHTDPFKFPTAPTNLAQLWHRASVIHTRSSITVRALDLEGSLLVALVHGLRDNFADLLHVFDVDLLLDAGPDWDFIQTFAAREGWTSLIRFSLAFNCAVLDRTPPVDTSVAEPARTAMKHIWPRRLLLKGGDSVAASLRRQALAGLFIEGRRREVAHALARRLVPRRALIQSTGEHFDKPYVAALYRWRQNQRNHVNAIQQESTQRTRAPSETP